ncbi:MAG: hypothetical protein OXS30_11325 [Chloroflexota bacterium]|nr:hypothetical protein [Chloroflexota bacterium]
MADTLSSNITASFEPIIERTMAQMPQSAPMLSLARKLIVPKGSNSAQIPRISSVSNVQTPDEGEELSVTSRFTLASNTISPVFRAIHVRIHVRAINYSREDLVRLVSDEMALSQGQDIDTDLTGEFGNWHTDNDVGASGEELTLAKLREGRRILQSVTRANGGPPRGDIVTVLSPIVAEHVLEDIGARGVGSGSNWIPAGISERMIRRFHVSEIPLMGTAVFVDGYMGVDGSGDYICSMFGTEALVWACSMDWRMSIFEEAEWPGVTLRSMADYNAGIAGYTHHGCQITADGG